MKILIVTSEVTFVPGNYNHFLEGLFQELEGDESLDITLIILKNNSVTLPLKGLLLTLIGARSIGKHLIKNSFKAWSRDRRDLVLRYNIPVHFFASPNTPDFHEFVKNHGTDLLVNARTRFIYKDKILKMPKIGSINIHHGLLPDYRGTMCDLWALYNDRPTGFSIHVMDKKIDNGSIIRQKETSKMGDKLRKNFSRLIGESSKIEGIEMANVIKTINKNQKIPIEKDNISKKPTYTKNPDFNTIRRMLQKGIKL